MSNMVCAYRSIVSLLVVVFASSFLMAQNDDPEEKEPGFKKVLHEEKEPNEGRKREAKPTTKQAKPLAKPQRSFKDRALDIKKQIAKLQKEGYSELDLIKSPKEAAAKINELKERRKSLDAKFKGDVAEATKETVKAADQFGEKWSSITGSMTDGKSKTKEEWMAIYRKSIGKRASKDPDSKGKPGSDNVRFDEIRNVMDQAKKPRGVSAQLWARVQDQFFKELAELQAKVASARKKVSDQQKRELGSIDRAISDAATNFQNLVDAKEKPSDAQIRNLAWQIQRARIAELIALHNRLMLADLEAEGLPNKIQIAIKPMSPSETLEDIARKIETSNRPGAPSRGQFDDLDADGLPNLFPSDPDLNKLKELMDRGEFYGNILKSRMDRNRRLLEDLNKELVNLNPNSVVDAERKKQIEKDIEWLIDRNATDSKALEDMQPDEKPKNKVPVEEKPGG